MTAPSPTTPFATPGGRPGIRSSSSKIAIEDAGASLARLEDERAAGRDRRADLAQRQVHRVVPRRDQPAHADRFLEHEVEEVAGRPPRSISPVISRAAPA